MLNQDFRISHDEQVSLLDQPLPVPQANPTRYGIDYTKAERQTIRFLTEYWIPASVSARLLKVSTSAAYEWIKDHSCPPRQAWFCSPLHRNGQRRRGLINRAVELYQNPEMSMRQVGTEIDVEVSTVYRYLQIGRRPWYRKAAEKHKAFASKYPIYTSRIEQMYE